MDSFIRQTFRIYPTQEQIGYFNQEIGNQRFIWNNALAANIEEYELNKKFIFYNELANQLPDLKEDHDWLKIGNAQSLQQTLKDLDLALRQSFKSNTNRKGFPKFKQKSNGGSFRVPQYFSIIDDQLKIPKAGLIKIIDNETGFPLNAKSVTIIKKPSGKWFASFVVPFTIPHKVVITPSSPMVGVDLNSKNFVVTSNGEVVTNPKHIKDKEKKLKRYQRKYARCVKGSNNQKKARIKVSLLHEKVANQRKDFVEKVTNDLVQHHDVICIEDLNVKAMQRFNGRMVQSAPFGLFRNKITWKANREGKHLVVIDRYDPTTKMCSSCGQLHEMSLKDRIMDCDCGNHMDRDHNAAINILLFGLLKIGPGQPELTPPIDLTDLSPEIPKLQDRSRSVQWGSIKPIGLGKEEIIECNNSIIVHRA